MSINAKIRSGIMLAGLFLMTALSGCQGQTDNDEQAFTRLDNQAFAEAIQENPDAVVLDVRTLQEFEEGHIPGAVRIDYLQDDFAARVAELDKDKPYYLYCRSGNRSAKAAQLMVAQGFDEVYELKTGFSGWNGPKE